MAAMARAMTATSPVSNGSEREHEIQRANNGIPVPAWWESIANARSAIQSLISVLGDVDGDGPFETLLVSESPAKALLDSHEVAGSISARLHQPNSGSASDALCRWLYDTFQTPHRDLHLVVLRYVPLIAGLYLSRLTSQTEAGDQHQQQHLAGFEAVLLGLYTAEVKARDGRPVLITVPDLAQTSLYHAPRNPSPEGSLRRSVGQLCAPLEPHVAVMSTKRASIVAVALDLFFRNIALMPAGAKIEACEFVQGWAGQNCHCVHKFDGSDDVSQAQLSMSVSTEDEIQSQSSDKKLKVKIDDLAKFSTGDVAYNSFKSPRNDATKLSTGDVPYSGGSSKSLGGIASTSSSFITEEDKLIGDVAYNVGKKLQIDDVTKLSISDVAYRGNSSKSLGAAAASSSLVIEEDKLGKANVSTSDVAYNIDKKLQIDDITKSSTADVAYNGNSSKSLGGTASDSSSLAIEEDKLHKANSSTDDVAYNIGKKLQIEDTTKLSTGDVAYSGNSSKSSLVIDEGRLGRARGARIPLPWELLQPILRILGHCLLSPVNSQEVRATASVATRMLFARVSHDLVPEAILATRSLIRLDIAAKESANIVAKSAASSTAVSQPKKPENLLKQESESAGESPKAK